MSVSLEHASLLSALGVEGGAVTISKPPSRPYYHVLFRHEGKLINRSTGTAVYAKARERGAEIFAEVIRGPKEAVTFELLRKEIQGIKALFGNPTSQSMFAATSSKPRAAYLPPIPATLGEAVAAFFDERKDQQLSISGEEVLQKRLRAFLKHAKAASPLEELNPTTVSTWSRVKGNLDAVRQFARWCADPARKWIDADLVAIFPKTKKSKPKLSFDDLLPADTLESLLRTLERENPEYVLFYALSAFAGTRANKPRSRDEEGVGETARLLCAVKEFGWDKFIREDTIWIPSEKVGHGPRIVHSPPGLASKKWTEG